jgi:predicted metal-dependent hydrolase
MGVDYKKISYRFQRSRWGSCSASGNLSFNCLLMLTSPQIIDAIIVHELAHRKEMNHSKKFYAEILRVYPDYYVHHGELQRVSSEIMRRNPNSK